MNLNLYKVFITVAQTSNFSKAAQELYLSQPAVSQMINQLEDEVDCKLFTRQSRGVVLTTEGKEFYEDIKIALNNIDNAVKKLNDMKLLQLGNLKIGASDTISRYILPKYLKEFSNRYPKIRISIKNGTSSELESMLLTGEVDLVLGFKPSHIDTMEFHTFMTLNEAFVTSKEYAKILPKVIDGVNINEAKIMMLDGKSETRKQIDAHLLMQNIILQPEFELSNYELLYEFAKQGLGIAILAKELINDLEILNTNINLPTRDVGFYYLKKLPLSKAAQSFVKLLEDR